MFKKHTQLECKIKGKLYPIDWCTQCIKNEVSILLKTKPGDNPTKHLTEVVS